MRFGGGLEAPRSVAVLPGWRNWQTRMVEGHVAARLWRFEPSPGQSISGKLLPSDPRACPVPTPRGDVSSDALAAFRRAAGRLLRIHDPPVPPAGPSTLTRSAAGCQVERAATVARARQGSISNDAGGDRFGNRRSSPGSLHRSAIPAPTEPAPQARRIASRARLEGRAPARPFLRLRKDALRRVRDRGFSLAHLSRPRRSGALQRPRQRGRRKGRKQYPQKGHLTTCLPVEERRKGHPYACLPVEKDTHIPVRVPLGTPGGPTPPRKNEIRRMKPRTLVYLSDPRPEAADSSRFKDHPERALSFRRGPGPWAGVRTLLCGLPLRGGAGESVPASTATEGRLCAPYDATSATGASGGRAKSGRLGPVMPAVLDRQQPAIYTNWTFHCAFLYFWQRLTVV